MARVLTSKAEGKEFINAQHRSSFQEVAVLTSTGSIGPSLPALRVCENIMTSYPKG